jgi:aminoglycoside phosphotransferase (APT) family kinase protein
MSEVRDPVALRAWLDQLGLDPVGMPVLERIGAGQSNLTFWVSDQSGRRWVVRRPPHGDLLGSAHDVLREARIMAAVQGTAVPVPRILGVLDDPPTVLMSCVEGVVLDNEAALAAMPTLARCAVGPSLARTLAAVHDVDLETTGLTGLASHSPYAARQLRRWARQWEQSRTRDLPALDSLTARLETSIPLQHETTLVHGDGHLLNAVCDPGTGDVIALLDWELSTLGDPLADLGTLLAYWPQPGEPAMQHIAPSQHPGFASREELVGAYADTTGRDTSSIGFWQVLGLWKLAVIAEGVLRRQQEHPSEASHQELPRERIDALVEHAHEVATAAGI